MSEPARGTRTDREKYDAAGSDVIRPIQSTALQASSLACCTQSINNVINLGVNSKAAVRQVNVRLAAAYYGLRMHTLV